MTNICTLAFSLKDAVSFYTIFQQVCAASKKKSLSGLDNVTSEGSLAFDTLEAAVHTIGSLGRCSCSYLSFLMEVTKRAW